MKSQRVALILTVINSLILILTLLWVIRPTILPIAAPVVRTRMLEIVDDQGKVRAQLLVVPAGVMPGGKAYPDTTLFRLIDPNGRPGIKIDTSSDGSGLLLTGDSISNAWSGVQIRAEAKASTVRLLNRNGQEQIIQP